MTFAQRVEQAAQSAHNASAPYMASKKEICDAIQPIINSLQAMRHDEAVSYIRASFSHVGHQALAVRMFKNQPV
jgi:predicted adenine nucleotide alpha hydrolase (AANH) superfamily ATPase